MPTYDYQCDACGKRMEAFHAMSDAPLKKCPKCSKRRLRRLIGAGAGVIFKGSGFYTTDYRGSSYETSRKSDSEPTPAKADSKTDSKTETSKTDTKSETSVKPASATDGGASSPAPAPAKKSKAKK